MTKEAVDKFVDCAVRGAAIGGVLPQASSPSGAARAALLTESSAVLSLASCGGVLLCSLTGQA
jgi:hypothetical protein